MFMTREITCEFDNIKESNIKCNFLNLFIVKSYNFTPLGKNFEIIIKLINKF